MTEDITRLSGNIPSGMLEEGEQYLIPTSAIRRAHGGRGNRFRATRVKVVDTGIHIDESSHKYAEGYHD